jgi:SAM-dependent methyltransferase
MNHPAIKWAQDLESWGIPNEILEQAPQSPWIHPPALFALPDVIADSTSHRIAREAMPNDGSVLDIGCGGGVAAFAVVPPAKSVFGVDHQQEMLNMFARSAESKGLTHQEIFGDWPAVEKQTPQADVVTCHHVVYNVSDIVPFLTALDAHAKNRVVIEMPQEHPLSNMRAAWKEFWNLDRPTAPTPADLVAVLDEMGIKANLELSEGGAPRSMNPYDAIKFMRIRLCLDSSRDSDIEAFIASQPVVETRKLATIWWDV